METSPALDGVYRLIGFCMKRALTEKFRRTNNRFLEAALYYLLLLILIVDLYFVLFMLCLSAQKCAYWEKFSLVLVVAKLECPLLLFQ